MVWLEKNRVKKINEILQSKTAVINLLTVDKCLGLPECLLVANDETML